LRQGSVISHRVNNYPSIFQNSHVLITKFRRTGLTGSHICEGIILNRPSLFKIKNNNKKSYEEFESESDEDEDEDQKDKKNNYVKLYIGGPCEMKNKFYIHDIPNLDKSVEVINGV